MKMTSLMKLDEIESSYAKCKGGGVSEPNMPKLME
jgi:hypothetical protein